MKRKRGNKKGKSKAAPVISANDTSGNKEEVSGLDDYDNNKSDSGMEAGTPSSTGTDNHCNLANINPDGSVEKAAGKSVGRVKVKIRTSKVLDSQPTSSDAPTQSDTDKSSQHQGFEKQGVNTERTEDSANSLPEIKLSVLSKKAGSIKIKSSKVLGSSSNQTGKTLPSSGGNNHTKETNAAKKNPRYNKEELDAALMVIRKVMKMDAAEPFNVPVNPEALGIPDYFDIIDKPMDFGTICSNLESNDKYMNSEDVFKDVQYIWTNCYKYNNKGDYILDLMRRVKKNFMKYWSAAGLYTEQAKGLKEDGGQSGEGKSTKGGQKQKSKKRHGRRHKHDCLCAICVLKRRRREREESARIAKGNIGSGDDRHSRENKQEESMQAGSPASEDSSSNMDESQGTDGDAEEEKGEEVKTEVGEKTFSPSKGKNNDMDIDARDDEDEDEDEDEDNDDGQEEGEVEDEDREDEDEEETEEGIKKKHKGDETVVEGEEQEGQALADQQQKLKESQGKQERAKVLEKFCNENPKLSSLCSTLFPKSRVSAWSGPNSLNRQRKSFGSSRTNPISAAVQTLMK